MVRRCMLELSGSILHELRVALVVHVAIIRLAEPLGSTSFLPFLHASAYAFGLPGTVLRSVKLLHHVPLHLTLARVVVFYYVADLLFDHVTKYDSKNVL